MRDYVIAYKNGVLQIKRDRGNHPSLMFGNLTDADIFRVKARKKQDALRIGSSLAQQLVENRKRQKMMEEKGSTISQTTEVKVEEKKSPIELVPESFENEK